MGVYWCPACGSRHVERIIGRKQPGAKSEPAGDRLICEICCHVWADTPPDQQGATLPLGGLPYPSEGGL
jgi:hypothetical protein